MKVKNIIAVKARSLKQSGLQRDSNPWPPRSRCDAPPTELWSHTFGARSIYGVHISCEEWNDVKYIWNNSYLNCFWPTSNSGSLHGPPCFLFAVLLVALGFANANHKRWIPICCKTSEASVVILAAKLKVVAESRTRVFVKHVASTCNIIFCCGTSWSQTSSTRNNAF